MGVKLRLGVRVAFAIVVGSALLLGIVGRGSARSNDVPTTISITSNQASVTEGDPAGASFTVNLNAPDPDHDLIVDYQPSNGAANSVTIAANAPSATITVPTPDDHTPADDTTLSVQLTGVTLGDGSDASAEAAIDQNNATATTTVVDNDWTIGPIVTTPSSATVSEKGSKTIDFQVSLPAPAPQTHAISVDYAINDGTAIRGKNYSVSNPAGKPTGTLTFKPGTQSVDVQITSIDDNVYGANTQFTVTFSNAKGATFSGGGNSESVTGTITEADAPPDMGISNCQGGGKVNGGDVATFPILLGGAHPATSVDSTVDYKTVDDSTIAGDYTPVSGTATIPPGSREFDVKVQTSQNPPAGSRSFHIQLSNAKNVVLDDAQGSCTIVSTANGGGGGGGGGGNEGSIVITDPKPVTDPASGSTTTVSVPLSLTLANPLPSTPGPVTVQWQTEDGTATAPTDYTATSGTVTWPAGMSGANKTPVTVTVNADPALTGPVTFTVAFTSQDATFAGDGTATITIVPAGSTTPLLSIGDASAPSKSGTIPVAVTLTPAATQTVTVAYATADGTDANAAKAGVNYTAKSGTLTFAPGVTTQTINIPIAADTSSGPDLDFSVNLSNATGGSAIAGASATVTILNDYTPVFKPPVITITRTPIKQPVPVPAPQPPSGGDGTHVVLVQLYTGTSTVTAKGLASFQIGCPRVAVKTCNGTAVFEVSIKQKAKKGKKATLKTVRVATGSFSLAMGSRATLNAKLTAAGKKLLATYKRIQVKATLTAKDTSGATGVTAWIVALQQPKAVARKVTSSKPKSNTKPKPKKK